MEMFSIGLVDASTIYVDVRLSMQTLHRLFDNNINKTTQHTTPNNEYEKTTQTKCFLFAGVWFHMCILCNKNDNIVYSNHMPLAHISSFALCINNNNNHNTYG